MEFKKYVLSVAMTVATALIGTANTYAETANEAATPVGITASSGSVSSSGTVRKRTNVRTVRTAASTGSTASGSAAVPSTSDPTNVERYPTDIVTASSATPSANSPAIGRKSMRGTGSTQTATGTWATNGSITAPEGMGDQMSSGLMAGLWVLAIAFQAFWLFLALFFGYCLYKIATKLGEPHAWLGFIPYVQTYTFVKCGGKSGWWVLWITIGYMALIIPGVILTLMVMHGISKRYGRGNGTTALFFFFPYVMLPVLAFSDVTATSGNGTTEGYAPAYAPNSYATPAAVSAIETMPVTTPAPESIFAPESPAATILDTSLETTASPATVDVLVPTEATETVVAEVEAATIEEPAIIAVPVATEAEPTASQATDANPIVKEAETIVDNGPGFKLPWA